MGRYVRAMRTAFAVAILLIIAGCAGPGIEEPDSTVVATSTIATSPPTTDSPAARTATTDTVRDDQPLSVRIDVGVSGSTTELSGTLADSSDPFGQFVSCSGLRKTFGTYSVLASTPAGQVRSIGVASNDLVAAPGVHDASVRVEFAAEPATDAIGTMTVADDFRSGSFVAFDSDGARIEGTFECDAAGAAPPEPLAAAATESTPAVEVIALLRSGDAQRLVGLVATDEDSPTLICPATNRTALDDETIVRVAGGDSLGAISAFELVGGDSAVLRLAVGAVTYSFDDVLLGESDDVTAGSFGGESNDVAVDGAFRCS